jgi:hypothetical protein
VSDEVRDTRDLGLLLHVARVSGVPNPRIGELCIDLAKVAGAGISLMTRAGNSGILYASDETASQVEDLQFTLGEGPCMEAFATGAAVFVADVTDPSEGVVQRWPEFVRQASALGVRAVYAIPLRIGAIRLGVMDLYRLFPGPLSPSELEAALLLADIAALSLLHPDSGATDLPDEVDRSTFRIEVHQATGMVQVQTGASTADALLLLRAHAFTEHRSIDGVARDVIERRLAFNQEDTR